MPSAVLTQPGSIARHHPLGTSTGAGALERLAVQRAEGFPNLLAARERTAERLEEMRAGVGADRAAGGRLDRPVRIVGPR